MLKKVLFWILLVCFSGLRAQEKNSLYQIKKIELKKDTITLEREGINANFFKILDENKKEINPLNYTINFEKAFLTFPKKADLKSDFYYVNYLKYPEILTKEYRIYDPKNLLSNDAISGKLYQVETAETKKNTPFDGLNTSGSITRGVTIGNNQNTVLNSNLDLQITGKISEKVSLSASLQDRNIPLQQGGYSQKLDQFDNIFMEMFSDKWNIRAGDIFLENKKSQFLNFNKKVQGLATNFDFGTENNKTTVFASVALVRGQYAKSSFTGQEGNQGPYKLKGQNGELYVLVISGSERVYINGKLLKRGENNDYVIDYNAGEITFTPLFSISSEMRINIEYQYSDRNYSRFVTYAGTTHENEKWSFGSYLYSENDLKNQPLQQNLSSEQVQILANSGDNPALMVAPSAYVDSYSDNKVLYKKTVINSTSIFEYSNDSKDELFNVRFSYVGNNNGNYVLKNQATIGRIYEFIAPINSVLQGNYDPIIPLIAPTKTQVATFFGKYNPTEKTVVDFEIGISNTDKNLFSTIDDGNNQGVAGKINAKQRLFSKKWKVDAFVNYQFIEKNFKSVERINSIEFDRDWNLGITAFRNQSFLSSGLDFILDEKKESDSQSFIKYQFQKLDFATAFSGNRQLLNGIFNYKNWKIQNQGSFLNSSGLLSTSKFIRNQTQTRFHFNKNWIGNTIRLENNQEINKIDAHLLPLSQRFNEISVFAGRGDSTKVFVELGFLKRNNDSLQNGILQRVNSSQTYFLKSKLIQNNKTDLSIYVNYRKLNFLNISKKSESSLNSRILYSDRFFGQLIQTGTTYETNSGNIPQQEFTYLEVAAGQGIYTWNDYNSNGIQELQEFEVAAFIDQAKYIRIFLPNRIYIKTHQNKFSQSLLLNPNQWQNEAGIKRIMSFFYNQTSFTIDRKVKSEGDNYDLNPFNTSLNNCIGLNSNFRNSLFFNRGKQLHSVTYSYLQSQTKNLLSIGSQESDNSSHQLQYTHLYHKSWLFNLFSKTIQTTLNSENFIEKNYAVKGYDVNPKISYLFSKNTSWDIFYEIQRKENQTGRFESLLQNRFGTSFSYTGDKKIVLNGELSFYQNKFSGNEFSSVGFQMLEGLQVGQNLTWRLLMQKNLTQFLDININYQGRKSELSQTIHTGNIQLRAFF